MPGVRPDFDGYLEDYLAIVRHQVRQPPSDYVRYRGVMPAWDNTPRRGTHALIVIKSSPLAYESRLRFAVEQSLARAKVQEPLIFVNAWNEWAEGAYLEPTNDTDTPTWRRRGGPCVWASPVTIGATASRSTRGWCGAS